jgi:hypothetical protein
MVANPWLLRLALAACLVALVAIVGLRAPRRLLYALLAWLVVLGLQRRLLAGHLPATAADPILVVGPVTLAVLAFDAIQRHALQHRTALANSVLILTTFVVLGALNPLQGSLVSGITALLFYAPLLAFWVGRSLCDDETLKRVLYLVAGFAVPAALYGMFQVFSGFPSWDQAWIDRVAIDAFNVGDAIRPFSTFSAPSEYATFLTIAVLVWIAFGARRMRPLVGVPVSGLLVAAVVYQGSRSILLLFLASLGMMLGAWRRLSFVLSVCLGAVLLLLLPFAVDRFASDDLERTGPSALLAHQIDGLANPLDPEHSTAQIHIWLVIDGMKSALREPLGHGIGVVTIAGQKFGGATYSAEADPGNASVALGLPGLLAYLALLVLGYGTAFRLARARRDSLSLVVLGILTVTLLQWLNGGQYAVAFLPWLVLGWADRSLRELREPTPEPAEEQE